MPCYCFKIYNLVPNVGNTVYFETKNVITGAFEVIGITLMPKMASKILSNKWRFMTMGLISEAYGDKRISNRAPPPQARDLCWLAHLPLPVAASMTAFSRRSLSSVHRTSTGGKTLLFLSAVTV